MSNASPCLSCGACCATFRVSFYWGELQEAGGVVPDVLTEQINSHRACMKGTNQKEPRCVALLGSVGEQVRCTIYENRPSPCREFSCNGEVEAYNEGCDKARARFGLPVLTPPEFPAFDDHPPQTA